MWYNWREESVTRLRHGNEDYACNVEMMEIVFSVGPDPRLRNPRPAAWSWVMRQLPALNTKTEKPTDTKQRPVKTQKTEKS
jgi:hypothetical protein